MPIFRRGTANRETSGARPHPASAAELPYPRWVEATDDPASAAVAEAAETRHWPTLRAALAEHRADDLTELIEGICIENSEQLGTWLPTALAPEHDDPLARTVLGAYTVHAAWKVRGAALPSKVGVSETRTFHAGLRAAEQYLLDAAVIDPADSASRYFLLVSGRGLIGDLPELMHRFERVIDREPGHRGAHEQLFQALCAKWHGSHETMFDFARAGARGPYASQLAPLVAQAYIERWVYQGRDEQAYALVRSAEARDELLRAAGLTAFRPGHRGTRRPYKDANVFAAAFTLAEMWPEAWRAFEAASGVINGFWVLVDRADPYAAYVDARAKAFDNALGERPEG